MLSLRGTSVLFFLKHYKNVPLNSNCFFSSGELVRLVNPIMAVPGDDVILPCYLDSQVDLQDQIVEWTKLEVKPDPADPQGRVPFVYFYRNRKTMTTVMIESLIPRVSLNQDGLKRGDVTLKIRNVSLQDEGKYSCFIPGKNFRETVQLVVGEFALQVLPHMKNICPEQQAGNDVISLFQSQTESEIVAVDMKSDVVFLYWNRQIITEHMKESFILRVSLDQDGLKRGDVTLKIRNVSLQDEGKYSCFIPGKNFRETVQLFALGQRLTDEPGSISSHGSAHVDRRTPPPTQWCSSSSNDLFVFFRIKCTRMHFCSSGHLDIFLGIS
uniref:Ig-like domain-containing protein n=1 Tax=Oryzias latipes TaxID=8090 RepID=H2LBK9_ORYLA